MLPVVHIGSSKLMIEMCIMGCDIIVSLLPPVLLGPGTTGEDFPVPKGRQKEQGKSS